MLTTPPELIDKVSMKNNRTNTKDEPREIVLPRILVDATGDSAIMVDPQKTITGKVAGNGAKRSDLIRLPSIRLAEHLDSSEFREVLFLSPEPEKIFESSDHRSLINLLYLYPRLLVLKSKDDGNNNNNIKQGDKQQHRYTVRVRLVQHEPNLRAPSPLLVVGWLSRWVG